MAGAEKVDDETVRITLKAPFPAALDFFALVMPFIPTSITSRSAATALR